MRTVFKRCVLLAFFLLSVSTDSSAAASSSVRDFVVVDEDWNVPGDFLCEANLPLLLVSPRVHLLALTAVTGDAWRDEGTANALRFLEEIGRPDLPVAKGATFPLVNTRARVAAWETRFGTLEWLGAWNSPEREKGAHPDSPGSMRYPPEGPPHHLASAKPAVDWLIELARRYPHRLTIIAGGPLTNLALAIRKDPAFAPNVRRLILGDLHLRELIAGKGGHRSPGFNEVFDPEAASIVLTAPWPEIVCLDPVENKDPITDARLLERIQKHPSPASNYYAGNVGLGTPLWAASYALVGDPSLIKSQETVQLRLAICCDDQSPLFGSPILQSADRYTGPRGGNHFTSITDFDWSRYVDEYVQALQTLHFASP